MSELSGVCWFSFVKLEQNHFIFKSFWILGEGCGGGGIKLLSALFIGLLSFLWQDVSLADSVIVFPQDGLVRAIVSCSGAVDPEHNS